MSGTTPLSVLCAIVISLTTSACVGFKTINEPLEKADPSYGYRPSNPDIRRERGDLNAFLAFSGGGTRAAAFAYGVMSALDDTVIPGTGEHPTLLNEVDTLSGVSGGSFPAAYYGLFGDRVFDEFEERFLRRNIQGAIVRKALLPWNLVGLATPWLSRSDLAEGIYNKTVFDEATFQTLTDARGPVVYINATDLSSGYRFTFTQGQFDLICSDLQALPISYAVAASSAVPMLLAPISLRNTAGTCGYETPALLEEALQNRRTKPRQYRAAKSFSEIHDPEKQYLHLIDGGISDNLGLRPALDIIEITGSLENMGKLMNVDKIPDKLIVISVNAETDPDPTIDVSSAVPGFAGTMNAVSGGQIRQANFETLLLTQELMERLAREARAAGIDMSTYLVDVSFENFPEFDDRRYFKRIPTSFLLNDHQIDELIWAGRELLLTSARYQELVRDLGGTMPARTPRPQAPAPSRPTDNRHGYRPH